MTIHALDLPATEIIPPFDYGALGDDLAHAIKESVDRIHAMHRRTVSETIAMGRELLAVKERLDHGQFGAWLAAEFGMTDRTAQNLMNAAREFGEETETVSVLGPSALYKLAAPSTPQEVKREVVERLQAGEKLQPKAVVEMVSAAKAAKAKAEREAREKVRLEKLTPEQRAAEKDRMKRAEKKREAKAEREARLQREFEEDRAKRKAEERAAGRILASCLNADDMAALEATGWYWAATIRAVWKLGVDAP